MTLRTLKKEEWTAYFNTVTKSLEGKRIEIDVEAMSLGDQRETANLPLLGISYDPKDNNVEVMMPGLNHRIGDATEIEVQESGAGIEAIHIKEQSGQEQILRLFEPLKLAP